MFSVAEECSFGSGSASEVQMCFHLGEVRLQTYDLKFFDLFLHPS